jgi:hypothetical protein
MDLEVNCCGNWIKIGAGNAAKTCVNCSFGEQLLSCKVEKCYSLPTLLLKCVYCSQLPGFQHATSFQQCMHDRLQLLG